MKSAEAVLRAFFLTIRKVTSCDNAASNNLSKRLTMPIKKKPKKEKVKKPGKLRVAALKAARATKRATARGSDFLGLTGAAFTPGAWTSATEGNPNSVWTGSVWTNVPTGPKDTANHGYPGNSAPGAWAQGGSGVKPPKPPRNPPPPSVGTPIYQQPQFQTFQPASTLLGQMYDIVRGVDPWSGNILPAFGTPGTLNYISLFDAELKYENTDTGRHAPGAASNVRFGKKSAMDLMMQGFGPGDPEYDNNWSLPSGLTGLSPKRFDRRPRWLEWYESIQ